jgi:hypothetical protein
MTDELDTTVAPSAIERAMAIFENFKQRDHGPLVQARKALTDHIFGQVAAGETDEQKLVVSGLAHLKSLERMAEAVKAMKIKSHSESHGRSFRAISMPRLIGSPRPNSPSFHR